MGKHWTETLDLRLRKIKASYYYVIDRSRFGQSHGVRVGIVSRDSYRGAWRVSRAPDTWTKGDMRFLTTVDKPADALPLIVTALKMEFASTA